MKARVSNYEVRDVKLLSQGSPTIKSGVSNYEARGFKLRSSQLRN